MSSRFTADSTSVAPYPSENDLCNSVLRIGHARRAWYRGMIGVASLFLLRSIMLHQSRHLVERAHAFLGDVLVRNPDTPGGLHEVDEFDDAGGIQDPELEQRLVPRQRVPCKFGRVLRQDVID